MTDNKGTYSEWETTGEELSLSMDRIKQKYSLVRKGMTDNTEREFDEELKTTEKMEIVHTILTKLKLIPALTIKDWIDMNNALLMAGTLYERAENDIQPEIDSLLHQYLNDKIDENACKERAMFLAMKAGIRNTDEFMAEFEERMRGIKTKLEKQK